MENSYNTERIAQTYLDFLASEDGRLQRRFLTQAISAALPDEPGTGILDAACGSGWLAYELSERYEHVEGCDGAPIFIDYAKKYYPKINFTLTDLHEPLLYDTASFDAVVLNMAAHDVRDQRKVFSNLAEVLKPNGVFIVTIPNPYYAYPVGMWKRGWHILLGGLPRLQLNHYFAQRGKRYQAWGLNQTSQFHTLAEYIDTAHHAGFSLAEMTELQSKHDSDHFNLEYQLYRYPLLLLLKFKKPA